MGMHKQRVILLLMMYVGAVNSGFTSGSRLPYKRLSSHIFRDEIIDSGKGFDYSDQSTVSDIARYLCSDHVQLKNLIREVYDTDGDGYISKEEMESKK